LLPWVMAMWPLAMVNTVLALWLTARGQERDVSLIMLLAAVSLTVCLPWWLHVWGLPGAALAVVWAQALQLAGSAWRLSRRA
jgi:Na+-driven multidrug efflux pump